MNSVNKIISMLKMVKKKVGTACRTKNQIRGSKVKGACLEYDVHYSLLRKYDDICLTKQLGFQQQVDVRSEKHNISIECKRLKGISWNQAKKFLDKLIEVSPESHLKYLVFKSNFQPCLVMQYENDIISVKEFKNIFGVEFEKHPSTRVKK